MLEAKRNKFIFFGALAVLGILIAGAFWAPLGALVSVGTVQGQRFYSLRVSSEEAWFAGYSIFIFRPPILRIAGDENFGWQRCQKPRREITEILRNFESLSHMAAGPFEYIVESDERGYDAYIKSGSNLLVYLSRYGDKSGDLPSEDERQICDTHILFSPASHSTTPMISPAA